MSRKTRKYKKKHIGGNYNDANYNLNKKIVNPTIYTDPKDINLKPIHVPTMKENIKKFADIWLKMVNSLGSYSLESLDNGISDLSKSYGVDINSDYSIKQGFKNLNQKTENLNKALDSPEGRQALQNLNNLFDKITNEVIVPTSTKLADDLIENMKPIALRGQNAVFALLSASPFGAIIDIPRFASESLGVVESSVSLANDALSVTTDAVDKLKSNKAEYDKVKSDFQSLIDMGNTQISNTLDSVNNKIDDFNSSVSFPNLQKQSQMIGGRVNKSKLEFLKPKLSTSQIIKKNKTRKYKRKYT